MKKSTIFKKLLFPCTFAGAAVGADGIHTYGSNCGQRNRNTARPSELPIYSKQCIICGKKTGVSSCPGKLENSISKLRKELWVWQDEAQGYRHKFVDVYRTGVAHVASSLGFLREEANGPERYGAIALSGVAGLIFGLRGGFFKKLVYSSTGALGMAAVCYPKEAAENTDLILSEAKKYFIVGYHFVFGEVPTVPDWKKLIEEWNPLSSTSSNTPTKT